MTKKQKKLLDFIKGFIAEHDLSPSFQEMADGIGCTSKSGINRLVEELWSQDEIDFLPGKARSIRIKCPLAFLKAKGLTQEYREWRA